MNTINSFDEELFKQDNPLWYEALKKAYDDEGRQRVKIKVIGPVTISNVKNDPAILTRLPLFWKNLNLTCR